MFLGWYASQKMNKKTDNCKNYQIKMKTRNELILIKKMINLWIWSKNDDFLLFFFVFLIGFATQIWTRKKRFFFFKFADLSFLWFLISPHEVAEIKAIWTTNIKKKQKKWHPPSGVFEVVKTLPREQSAFLRKIWKCYFFFFFLKMIFHFWSKKCHPSIDVLKRVQN